jgi:hypothetical protein
MTKGYLVVLGVLVLLALAASAVAEEIDGVQILQGTPVPLREGSALSCGTTIYQNTASTYFYGTTTPRWNLLDDGNFPTGTAPVCLGCIEFAFYQSASSQLYVVFDFYDTLVTGGPVCNLTWLGGYIIDFGVTAAGMWTSGTLELPTPITFPDDRWCVSMMYLRSVSPVTPSTTATVLFANGGPSVGTNDASVYWRDANGSGTFECPGEARSFAAPNKAQFYLKMDATLVPSSLESSSWGAIKSLYR